MSAYLWIFASLSVWAWKLRKEERKIQRASNQWTIFPRRASVKNDTREPTDDQEDEKPMARTKPRPPAPPGHYSNAIITRRNGGVPHRFLDSIGGCSANYR